MASFHDPKGCAALICIGTVVFPIGWLLMKE
jgi:hypothetical protein